MIHQLEIDWHDHGSLGITACPERNNPAAFIA
jgi:hypothetical protein